MSRAVRVIDLFTGAGGLTQGWHQAARALRAKTRTVAAVEFDPAAAATYRANFGAEGQYVGPIETWLAEGNIPRADVIIGGPPCQGFSALGRRDIHDERNLLWEKYAETIQAAEPRYFVLENVRPFLKSPQFSALRGATAPDELLQDYDLEALDLSAADYGTAQNRRRAVVIGRRRELPPLGVPPKTHEGQWRNVREAFLGIPDQVEGTELPEVNPLLLDQAEKLPGPFTSRQLHLGRNYTDLSLNRFRAIPQGGNRFDLPDHLLSQCWRDHKTGASDVMGRLRWDDPSVTIRTEFFKPEKGRYLHPEANRAITHFEAARLQGFPDDFLWYGSKVAIARQIGNAVPVPLAEALGELVLGQFLGQHGVPNEVRGRIASEVPV